MLADTVLVFLFCATAKPLWIGLHRRCVSQHLRERHGGQDQQKYTVGVTSSCGWNDIFFARNEASCWSRFEKSVPAGAFRVEKLWKDSAS